MKTLLKTKDSLVDDKSESLRSKCFSGRASIGVVMAALMLSGCESELDKSIAAGEEIYNGTCKVCHAQGINGAPILGNKKMWSKRAPQGIDTLVAHASEGFGLMPAKGGNESLTETDLRNAITFMLSRLEQ